MAIYKNREVSIVAPTVRSMIPDTIKVRTVDGLQEDVLLGQVRFTEDEKKMLVKNFPSQYDGVLTVTEDDLKAVRLGVPPSYDTAAIDAARTQVQGEKQREFAGKLTDKIKSDQKAKLDKELSAPAVKYEAPVQAKK